MKRLLVYLAGFIIVVSSAVAQPTAPKYAQGRLGRFVYNTLHDTSSAASSKILVFPTLGYAPETSLEIGVRAFSLYFAKDDTTNRLSEIVLYAFGTLRGQFGGQIENAVYSNRNRYFLLGRTRYQQFPLLYYGIGPETRPGNPALVNSNYIQVRQRALRRVIENWYAGVEFDFQSVFRVSFEPDDPAGFELPLGSDGYATLGLGPTLVFDSRKNVLNVRKGAFMEVSLLYYQPSFGYNFRFQQLLFDGRLYRPLGRPNRVLAMQATGTFMSGTVPFNNLALLGGENTMRGYYLGRYRDKNLLAVQSELRWLPFNFSKRWGATLFAGLGTVAPTLDKLQFNQVRWAVGGGVRFLFFQRKDVYLRGDLGVTREGTGIYLSLGEAF